MAALRSLAVAVANGRVGYVYIKDGELLDWGLSLKAAKSTNNLAAWLQKLINDLKPDVVITEKDNQNCRKGKRAKRLIATAQELASHNYVLDVAVEKQRLYDCKYTEAKALLKRYPELTGWLPKKRPYFGSEPRNTILFEALALAEQVMLASSEQLAASMG